MVLVVLCGLMGRFPGVLGLSGSFSGFLWFSGFPGGFSGFLGFSGCPVACWALGLLGFLGFLEFSGFLGGSCFPESSLRFEFTFGGSLLWGFPLLGAGVRT